MTGTYIDPQIEAQEITDRQNDEIVTRCAPAWAWEIIDETLEMDSNSSAFDKSLRTSIREAYEAMIEACEQSA
jgi:hypothetical protein